MNSSSEALFAAELNGPNVAFARYPANAAAVALTGDKANLYKYGAYAKIVAAAVIPVNCWLTKVYLDTPTGVQAATAQVFLVELAKLVAAVDVVIFEDQVTLVSVTAVGAYTIPPLQSRWTPVIPGQPQIDGRLAQGLDGANTWGAAMSFQVATGLFQ